MRLVDRIRNRIKALEKEKMMPKLSEERLLEIDKSIKSLESLLIQIKEGE